MSVAEFAELGLVTGLQGVALGHEAARLHGFI
jgi:hypothetical protein